MKKVTVAVDEETYRLSRIRAAERRSRVLHEVAADFDRRGVGLRMVDNLSREALYRDREPAAGPDRASSS